MNSYSDRPYPLFRRNLKLEELYKKVEERNTKGILKQRISKKSLVWMFIFILCAVMTPFTITQLQKAQELRSNASVQPMMTIIEAEDGIISNEARIRDDFLASNGLYIDLGPNAAGAIDVSACPPLPNDAGRLNLAIQINKKGNYYFWGRYETISANNNSFYVSLDNSCPVVAGGVEIPVQQWQWINTQNFAGNNRIQFYLEPGNHTMSIVARDPGVRVDRFILTNDEKCDPILKGDNCVNASTGK
jgi:hypothetical protein